MASAHAHAPLCLDCVVLLGLLCVLPSGRGEQACFLWEGNDLGQDRVMTYKQVLDEVCQLVSVLGAGMCVVAAWGGGGR
jgi:hypothetical protein